MGGMLGNKRQDRGKKKFRGPEIFGGTFWGNAKKGVEKLFGGSKKWWEFLGVTTIFGGRIFQEKFKKKKSPGGILWKIVKKKFSGDFLGGRIQGDVCVGDCWEIKDKIGEKKNSGGQKLLGGRLFGEMPKKGWKNFLAVPKSGGNFFGGHNNFLGGEFFRKNLKKKHPLGVFSGKLSKQI